MLGSMRRMEARIGELLGPDGGKGGRGKNSPHAEGIHWQRRAEFRALAGLVDAGLLDYRDTGPESAWRASRRALLLYSTVQDR
jgi:hypothetical protein